MTSGDEAGALTESEVHTDSGADAHDVPAPAEPDPGGTDAAESASAERDSADPGSVDQGSADSASAQPEPGDTDSGDADSGGDEKAGGPAGAGAWVVSVAVLSLLLIAGLVTAGMFWNRANAVNATNNGRQAAESTARTAVTDLFTTSYKDPGAFATKLKPLAAGQFLSVVSNAAAGFSKILAEGKVETTGQVQQIAVQNFDGNTAKVAVLAYETVKNTQTPQGSERAFRMSLSLIKSGPNWLVSNLEFVQ